MKIFIDAGHNDSKVDTGASGNGLREQDLTFAVAHKLASKLKSVGVDTKVSRENKTDILGTNVSTSLSKRAQMANQWSADLFISIHCNAAESTSAKGTEVYTYNTTTKAYPVAKNICNAICKKLGTTNRGVKTASYAVLKQTNMPAMLVELAFISNTSDAKLLKDKQDDFVAAMCDEICKHYNIKKAEVAPKQEVKVDDAPKPTVYRVEGTTHIIEVDPRNLWVVETQCPTNQTPYHNFVNSVFFMPLKSGKIHPQGIMVNSGKVIANNPTHGKPVATLIVHGRNNVEMKYVTDITKEESVWTAVSGYGIYPKITAAEEGFTGQFSDVTRTANRPIIGYRKKDNRIVIAVRAGSNAERAHQTAKNLGLDFAISLDGGGSTTLKVKGEYKFPGDGRKLFGGIIWS